jgi:hypothetical protein
MTTLAEIRADYRPYDTLPEFEVGFQDYMAGRFRHRDYDGVAGQAYDRGSNAAMQWQRVQDGLD